MYILIILYALTILLHIVEILFVLYCLCLKIFFKGPRYSKFIIITMGLDH